MDTLKFTTIDDTNHVIGPGEYTVCGQAIPFGNGYATDQPKKLCSDCKSRSKDTQEFGVLRSENKPVAEPLVDEPETPADDEAPAEPVEEPAPKATKDTADTGTTAKATKASGSRKA